MKKVSLLIFIFLTSSGHSQVTVSGCKGLFRVFEAETVYPGNLYVNPSFTGYVRENEAGTNLHNDHTINTSITLGVSDVFEIFTHAVPYQDDQISLWGPPGDTKVGLKFHVPSRSTSMLFGLLGYVSFPTAKHHNVTYEPFSADARGWALMGLWTVDLKNASSTFPLKISLNAGYRDHDWEDRFFTDSKDQLLAGFGFKIPIRSSLLYSEVTGEFFTNNQDNVAFDQNSYRFTQGFRFLGPGNLVFDLGADFELGRYVPTAEEMADKPYLKDYADWKIIFGISYRATLFKYVSAEEKLAKKRQKTDEEKMDSIKEKRENVLKELEEIRRKLEKEKGKQPE